MFCGLEEEERTKIRKKKKEKRKKRKKKEKKKEINLIAAKIGLVGMKGYLETYTVLKPFLTETAFYAKLAGRFSGSKTEVT